jgi:hypothetical protein
MALVYGTDAPGGRPAYPGPGQSARLLELVNRVPLLAMQVDGERMAFTDLSGHVFGAGSGAFGPSDWPADHIRCAEALAEVQELAGAFFALPPDFTAEDQYNIDYARTLLHGEDAHITWSGAPAQLDAAAVMFFLEGINQTGEVFTFFRWTEETVQVGGEQLPVGWVMRIAHSTRITNLADVRAWYEAGAEGRIEVRLDPANTAEMTVRLAPEEPAEAV